MLIAEDNEAYQEAYMEEFIKGFEILKLRIGKLKSYSTELDQMVGVRLPFNPAPIRILTCCRGTRERGSVC